MRDWYNGENCYLRANSWRESKLGSMRSRVECILRRPRGHRNNFIGGYVKGAFPRWGMWLLSATSISPSDFIGTADYHVPRDWLFNSPATSFRKFPLPANSRRSFMRNRTNYYVAIDRSLVDYLKQIIKILTII